MARAKLTATNIETLRAPPAGQTDYFDATLPGFYLRVTANKARSYGCMYRIHGKLVRHTIGRHPKITLAQARTAARAAYAAVSEGRDPRAEKQERQVEAIRAREDLFLGAVEDFITKHAIAKKQNRRHAEQKRLLLRADPSWHSRPIASIATRDVHKALDALVAEEKGYSANRTYEALGTFFKWLYARDRVPTNVMAKIERPFDGEKPRERTWSNDELKAIWKSADKLDADDAAYLRLLLLLGQRRNEIAGMRWGEIDLDNATWELSAELAKAKRVHLFPLPALAVRILKSIPRVEGNPFVFPGRGTRTGAQAPMTVGSKIQRLVQQHSGVADFTFHDARRTFRTGLDKLKVPPHIKDECLNHARRGVGDRHYSKYYYLDEQREAFELWAKQIAGLVYPKGVVPLRA